MESVTPHGVVAREVLASAVATSVGPVFICNILNWMFFGTLIIQTWTYYQNYPSDRLGVRVLVYTIFILDLAQTIILTDHGWWVVVTTWGNPEIFDIFPWSASMITFFSGLVGGIVQTFYAFRIWRLAPTKFFRAIAVIVVVLAVAEGLAAMVSGLMLLPELNFTNLLRLHPGFSTWLVASLVDDVIIASCMTYILGTARKKTSWNDSETLLTKLINRVITTGTATALTAAVELGLFLGFPLTNYHVVPAYILGKLYSNSLMLTLNLRRPHHRNQSTFSDSLPMTANSVKFVHGAAGSDASPGLGGGQVQIHVEHETFGGNTEGTATSYDDTKWVPADQLHVHGVREHRVEIQEIIDKNGPGLDGRPLNDASFLEC